MKLILSEGDSAILEDPFYIFVYKKLYDLIVNNKKLSPEDEEYRDELLALVDKGLDAISANEISAIVRSSAKDENINDTQIIKAYKEILGDRVSSNIRLISADEAATEQSRSLDRVIARRDEQRGVNLANKLSYLVGLGVTGTELSKAINTSAMLQPANIANLDDLKNIGFSDENIRNISKYSIPEDKEQVFNKALFNVMQDYTLLSEAGVSKQEVADTVYSFVVQSIKHNDYIELPISLAHLCRTTSTLFDGAVQPEIRKTFEDALSVIPLQKRTKEFEELVNNAIVRYSFIKEYFRLSASQVVSKLITLTESDVSSVPAIRYMSSSDPSMQKANIRLKFDDIIENAINSEKSVKFTKPIDWTNIQTKSKFNLFDAADLTQWLKTKVGEKSGLDPENLTTLASKVRKNISLAQDYLPKSTQANFNSIELQPILVNNVTADLSQLTQFIAFNSDTSQINSALLGLPLLSKVDEGLLSSLAVRPNFLENNDFLNNLQNDLPIFDSQVIIKPSNQLEYKTEDENLDGDENNSQQEQQNNSQNSSEENPQKPKETEPENQKNKNTSKGLSDFEIASIVIGSVSGAGLIVGGVWLYNKCKSKQDAALANDLNNNHLNNSLHHNFDINQDNSFPFQPESEDVPEPEVVEQEIELQIRKKMWEDQINELFCDVHEAQNQRREAINYLEEFEECYGDNFIPIGINNEDIMHIKKDTIENLNNVVIYTNLINRIARDIVDVVEESKDEVIFEFNKKDTELIEGNLCDVEFRGTDNYDIYEIGSNNLAFSGQRYYEAMNKFIELAEPIAKKNAK